MNILETEHLILRTFSLHDAAFMLRLVNEPSWIAYIGDHEVANLDEARDYIRNGPLTMYDEYGFSLCMVELREGRVPIGVCGIVKRDSLPDPDLGFALLPEFWGQGYAYEAASAILEFGRAQLGIARILAISLPHNARSIKLLERLGFSYVRMFRADEASPELQLFMQDL
jgi:RimJ/RimL family protein N-acetyltransferase